MTVTDIVVDKPGTEDSKYQNSSAALVSWIVTHVKQWEQHRDNNYREKFEEYYRLWRGIWDPRDRTRKSERSKLISPATAQAVDSTVAELEEATFGKGKYWVDISDDIADQQKTDMALVRDQYIEDLSEASVPDSVSKIYLYGTIFGTGIGKIYLEKRLVVKPVVQAVQALVGPQQKLGVDKSYQVVVGLEPIHPLNFAIDPAARSIDEAKGCAQRLIKPTHTILQKQQKGIYLPGDIGSFADDGKIFINDEDREKSYDNYTNIIEYHGLVPRALIEAATEEQTEDALESVLKELAEEKGESVQVDESDMVESIVTIANEGFLLRAVKNPNVMEDRGFISYQHDTVPNAFWGRGVPEKGYNPQKALDADLRSRIDALALITHPMMAMDANRLVRGQKLSVTPGKTLLTNGNPSDVMMPFHFGNLETSSFMQTADLERQIQVGTGAMDTAAPLDVNARNQTATGMSMISASMLKRQKRTKQNIDRQFLAPLIKKTLWRYMQYAPDRYPVDDYKFEPVTSMGLMAREYEQAQLTNLLNILPKDSPMFGVILKGIIENSSVEIKQSLLDKLEQYLQPNPQQQQMQELVQQLTLQNQMLTNEKLKSEATKNYSEAGTKQAKLATDSFNAQTNRITAITNAHRGAKNEQTRP